MVRTGAEWLYFHSALFRWLLVVLTARYEWAGRWVERYVPVMIVELQEIVRRARWHGALKDDV